MTSCDKGQSDKNERCSRGAGGKGAIRRLKKRPIGHLAAIATRQIAVGRSACAKIIERESSRFAP